jgi:hypothetical protein
MPIVNVPNTVEAIIADHQRINGAATREPEAKAVPAAKTADTAPNAAETRVTEPDEDDDDDDGVSAEQKAQWTEEMRRTVAKKHGRMKGAEEFATKQYNERLLAEKRARELERELTLERAKRAEPTPADTSAPAKPDRTKFASDEAYQDALIDYRVDEKLRAQESARAKAEQEARDRETIRLGTERVEAARQLVPDWQETVEAISTAIPPPVAIYLQESEMIAELSYHLAKHPKVLETLTRLTPSKMLVEIGKIESKLQPFSERAKVKTVDASEKVTPNGAGKQPSADAGQAPSSKPRPVAPVIRPLAAGSAAQVDKPDEMMSATEALEKWQAKRGVDLSRRKRH